MERTECSETSAYEIQAPGNYPEESIQHSEHGESLKSIIYGSIELLQRWKEIYLYLQLIIAWRLIIESQVLAMRCKNPLKFMFLKVDRSQSNCFSTQH